MAAPVPASADLIPGYAPHIRNRTILITGVSPGSIGASYVAAVAAGKPALLILAGRNAAKTQQTADEVTAAHGDVAVRTLSLDLASLDAVRAAAAEVNGWEDVPKIDVLVNNAGIMAPPYELTKDGIESQFGSNHVAHFLLTNLLMGKLLASEAPRVVSVSSDGHRLGHMRWDDINFENGETYNKWTGYGQSKTANMLLAISLAEKLGKRGLLAFSLHPGVIFSNLASGLDMSETGDFALLNKEDRKMGNAEAKSPLKVISLEQGSATHVFASFDPSLKEHNGAYLVECRVADPYVDTVKPWGTSSVEADRLWKLSEKLVGQQFQY